jgi:hypothetical protein
VEALALWGLGYADQARARIDEALTLTQKLAHPNSRAGALFFAAWVHQLRPEKEETYEQAEAVKRLSREQGFPFWLAWGTVIGGD